MFVLFIHGPAASGKYTIASRVSEATGLALFHNHLAVDAASALFAFGTPGFNTVRATIWLAAFSEAAKAKRSFIFTFQPEASVDPGLIQELLQAVSTHGGETYFVELACSRQTVLARLGEASRTRFGKLTDGAQYRQIEAQGGFEFPALPQPLLTIDTDVTAPDDAAARIVGALKSTGAEP